MKNPQLTCPHCRTIQKTRMSAKKATVVFQVHPGPGGLRCVGSGDEVYRVPEETTTRELTEAEQALVDALSNTSPIELERFSGLDRARCQTILSLVGHLSRLS